MTGFSPAEIVAATGAVKVSGKVEEIARGISIDSRTVLEGQLFVAIRGKRFDGNEFVAEAIAGGAAAAVVDRRLCSGMEADVKPIWRVPDTLEALGKLARFHRDRFRVDLAAITGSSGKSTTKTMLAHLLSADREVLATPGTQNNRIGVPLTLFRLQENHRAAVLEMGTNQWGEIRTLTGIARPTLGAVINIGPAHLETFGDLRGVLRAKGELWEAMEPEAPLVLNGDDPLLRQAGRDLRRKIIWFGCGPEVDVRATELRLEPFGSTCKINGRWTLRLAVPGQHNVMNALAALACAQILGLNLEEAAARMESIASLPGRLNCSERDGMLILDDSYNANPASLSAALKVLQGIERPGRKVVVLGDMLELGAQSEALHAQAGQWVVESKADALITVGGLAKRALAAAWEAGLPSGVGRSFDVPEQAGEFLAGFLRAGDALLLKGSRAIQMERVLACFTISSTH